MLTLFTIPKPFAGHVGLIQRNALASWRRALPGAEIFVCGDEEGARKAADRVGARFMPDVSRTDLGTPLLGSIFRRVTAEASQRFLAYANADIVLLPDLAQALRRVTMPDFLLVARRWNLDVDEAIDFSHDAWSANLRARARAAGRLYRRDAVDLFVFPRASPLPAALPEFAVGRPGWDNWLIYRARMLGIPVIDATSSVTIVHQNHGYGHVPAPAGDRWEGPEARRNRKLMGGSERVFDIGDATHVLEEDGLRRARGLRRALRSVETLHLLSPVFIPIGRLGFALRGIVPVARRALAAVTRGPP